MGRNKLYFLMSTVCAAGYIWITIEYNRSVSNESDLTLCLFKYFTNIPCPSCGSTRSVLSLLKGDFLGSLMWNPLGLILMAIMVISPGLILYDVLLKKATLFNLFNKTELFLKRKWIAIPTILLVLLNWIWNIYKGL